MAGAGPPVPRGPEFGGGTGPGPGPGPGPGSVFGFGPGLSGGGLPGIDIEGLQRSLRRRVILFGVGVAVAVVGAQLDPVALQWPLWSGTLVWIVGLAVSMLGALGLATGSGCLAQILGSILLGSLVCSATATSHPGTAVLAGAMIIAGVAGSLLRRRARAARVRLGEHVLAHGGSSAPHGRHGPHGSGGGDGVIDVDAHDKD